jgi:hypothetical protein
MITISAHAFKVEPNVGSTLTNRAVDRCTCTPSPHANGHVRYLS